MIIERSEEKCRLLNEISEYKERMQELEDRLKFVICESST